MPSKQRRLTADIELRSRIDDLLHQGSNSKLLRGDRNRALQFIREAYDLTHDNEGVAQYVAPWPALTAYRLAHLTLRMPSLTEKELLDADEWLKEASDEPALGPWPSLYRLAVIHRLQSREQIKPAFDRARERVLLQIDKDFRDSAQLQHYLFNALELSAYFLDQPYKSLEGIGGLENQDDPYVDIEPDYQKWMLVGPDPSISEVKYPRALALKELDVRETGSDPNTQVVLFKFPQSLHPKWKRASDPNWASMRGKTAKILTGILLVKTREQVREWLGAKNDSTFRSDIRRAKKDFRDLAGISMRHVPGQLPSIPPEVIVYGAVDCNALATPM